MANKIDGPFKISSFKQAMTNYARPYLFYAQVQFPESIPQGAGDATKFSTILAQSTTLPQSSIDEIVVPWQGQDYKMGSTHTFADFDITFRLDGGDLLRKSFIEWTKLIHDPKTNFQNSPGVYYGGVKLEHLNGKGDPVMTYVLRDAWPKVVGQLNLDYNSKTAVAEFTVTFSYQYFDVCAPGGEWDPEVNEPPQPDSCDGYTTSNS